MQTQSSLDSHCRPAPQCLAHVAGNAHSPVNSLQRTATSTSTAVLAKDALQPNRLMTEMEPCTPRTMRGGGTSPRMKARGAESTTDTFVKVTPPQS